MTITIINSLVNPSVVEVPFSWSPAVTYTQGSVTSPAAAANVALTFTAAPQIDGDTTGELTLVEFRWDFGDGVQAYGNPATHTYIIANLQAFTVLRVLDSKGRYWYSRHQMYL